MGLPTCIRVAVSNELREKGYSSGEKAQAILASVEEHVKVVLDIIFIV